MTTAAFFAFLAFFATATATAFLAFLARLAAAAAAVALTAAATTTTTTFAGARAVTLALRASFQRLGVLDDEDRFAFVRGLSHFQSGFGGRRAGAGTGGRRGRFGLRG